MFLQSQAIVEIVTKSFDGGWGWLMVTDGEKGWMEWGGGGKIDEKGHYDLAEGCSAGGHESESRTGGLEGG